MSNFTEFKRELHTLLAKYRATISADCGPGSDTHGIYGECLEVSMPDPTDTRREETHTLAGEWYVDARSLRED